MCYTEYYVWTLVSYKGTYTYQLTPDREEGVGTLCQLGGRGSEKKCQLTKLDKREVGDGKKLKLIFFNKVKSASKSF